MPKTDIARRVYNHTWKLDPIVRSLLDTDFYKLLMLQMIWGLYPEVDATFSLINRTHVGAARRRDRRGRTARPARPCAHAALHQEGDDLAGRQHLLRPQADLRAGVPALARRISSCRNTSSTKRDGQYRARLPRAVDRHHDVGDPGARHHQRAALARGDEATTARSRSTCSMPAPRPRCGRRSSGCKQLPDLRISDFGTRRRHSFLWQRWCVEALKEGLGDAFTGTSQRAARHGQRPRGDRHQCA